MGCKNCNCIIRPFDRRCHICGWYQDKENGDPSVVEARMGHIFFTFGKYKDKYFEDVPLKELDSYLAWMEDNNVKPNVQNALRKYLKLHEAELEKELRFYE